MIYLSILILMDFDGLVLFLFFTIKIMTHSCAYILMHKSLVHVGYINRSGIIETWNIHAFNCIT